MTGLFNPSNVIRVAAFGMDDRMKELMKMAFQGPGKGSCELSPVETADIFIFNMDSSENVSLLLEKQQRAHPDRPVIVMALENPDIPNTIFLKKPFKVEQLLNSLKSANENKQHAMDTFSSLEKRVEDITDLPEAKYDYYDQEREFCGSNRDVDLGDAESLASIYYTPSDYIQEQIFYASRISKTDQVAVQIAVKVNDKWELITFLPSLQGVFTTLSDFQLRVICTAPKYCTEIKIHRYSEEETTILETGPRTKTSLQKLEPFLWKVALWTSRGRLPKGTSLSSRIKLHRWPNFTRLHAIPNCMRIATLLMDEARPLKIVAKVLNIPQRHVFAFYSATHALGLATNLNANETVNTTQKTKKHKQHSLLGRILRRLTGAATN